MANLTFVDTHNMVAYLSKSNASTGFDQIVDFLNAQVIQYALMVNPTIYVSCIKQFWATVSIKKVNYVVKLQALIDRKRVVVTEDIIRYDLRSDDADGVDCLPTADIFCRIGTGLPGMNSVVPWPRLSSALPRVESLIFLNDLTSHTTKYTSPALTQKVFANIRNIGKGFSGIKTPLFATMLVQPQAAVEEDDEDDEVSAAPTLPSSTHEPTPPLKINLSMHPNKGRIEAIDGDKDITLIDMETEVELDVELQGRIERKEDDNAAIKEVNAAEPTVFDDDEVRPIFEREYNKVQTFLKPDRDEEPTKKKGAGETLLQESFKKLRAEVEFSVSHSTQDTRQMTKTVENGLKRSKTIEIDRKRSKSVETIEKGGNRSKTDEIGRRRTKSVEIALGVAGSGRFGGGGGGSSEC
uniref:Xylulose kinase-1 n=1 Tax=Tanacetum cinerariifolium TaxID=118510 RepID=A0A699HZY0_TANCI|nr:hypothetical protein [Tanacetum cinerariifolium]